MNLRAKQSKKRIRAFSMGELLIVLAVVGVLAAFAAPTLMTLQSTNLTTTSNQFGSFLNLCRSKAIAERTSIRVGIVTEDSNPDDAFRKYAGWEWDKKTESYVRFSNWNFLPTTSVFEDQIPSYVSTSSYAERERSAVKGDYAYSDGFENESEETLADNEVVKTRYITYSPSGRAYVDGGEHRNIIVVIRASLQDDVRNWYQFTIDSLTGRFRIYQP